MSNVVEEVLEQFDTQQALADLCGVKQQTVSYWLKVGYVPPEYAPKIERETGISRKRLSPDFPWEDSAA